MQICHLYNKKTPCILLYNLLLCHLAIYFEHLFHVNKCVSSAVGGVPQETDSEEI